MKIGKFKISRTVLVIAIIILLIVGYFVIKNLFKNPLDGYELEKISKGEVVQEVSETGSVRATKEVSLSFKSVGKIARVNVNVGDVVKQGDILAELDSSEILAQLQSAKAALSAADTQYKKLLKGSTSEDIQTYRDAVASASNDLQSAYNSSFTVLDDAYNKMYNAYNVIVEIQYNYFPNPDQQGIKVSDARKDIDSNMQSVKKFIEDARKTKVKEDTDLAVSQTISALDNVYNDLKIVRDQCDQGVYYLIISATDKASLDSQKAYVNTASASVTASQQGISSYKIALQKAENSLALKTANPRSEDVDIYKSQIEQAQANVSLYQSQLNENYISSPIDGKITSVNAKRGETVTYSESIIDLLSLEPFQVKVDIYEQDIVNVNIGNPVKINLVAFSEETFEGKVLSVDPAEKIVDNVVYYQVTIDFPNQTDKVRSGMTADIVIETNKKEDVLRISKGAVENIDGVETVQVVNNKKIENREIEIGLEGTDYYEVTSGLNEGDEIVLSKK